MNNLIPFDQGRIRKIWHHEQWYFSVIDIVAVLTEQPDYQISRKYWNKLAERLKKEGSEVVTNCHRLKLVAQDGKMRETDAANTETLLRLIQSVPSPKAEPLKLWLARMGTERIAEIQDPSQGIDRARALWQKHGRSEKWIQQRMMGQETRNKLTDYWKDHGVAEGDEYAILTNIIHQEWTDLSVQDHKTLKGLSKPHNLRDHMNEAELILTALAELSTRQIADSMQARGLRQNKIPAQKGGRIAKNARRELESKTGKSVITDENFLAPLNKANKIS
ncbi:hypothetical protein AUK40_03820 [Candidatus Wirthbacteria bacterium CG2_30_54_11]|uniref:Bro-N domain-containing protein n=1 Tax=Candidatus Wirthbacteria bacterium CG2_30_54_11 TaxID=1817892 RepID=A0A1J5IJC0_9BACT|nr:MAG: hypothetical protein AUK40_03820 [Candidatus Wirthbacteria bacterium CG2_30_54_11]